MSFWRNSKIVSCALGGKIYLYIGHNIYSRVFQLLFIHLVAVLDENVVRTGSQILGKREKRFKCFTSILCIINKR